MGYDWLDIELAPTDGTRVIIWCDDYKEVAIAAFDGHDWLGEYEPIGSENSTATIYSPTHWMPLPSQPKV